MDARIAFHALGRNVAWALMVPSGRPASSSSVPATMTLKMWSHALSRENFFPGSQSRKFAQIFLQSRA